jgi:hypothetical protein
MKLTKSLFLVLAILGELLILGGIMISFTYWPNISQGFYVGPILIVAGISIEIIGIRRLGWFIRS